MKRMKVYQFVFLLFASIFLFSCDKDDSNEKALEGIDFGESVYFEPFLWVKSDTIILSKEMKFEFSDYAVEEGASLKLQFVDENNSKLDTKNVSVYLNDKLVSNGVILIKATANNITKKIGLKFLPAIKGGDYDGYLTVIAHDFDRIENFDVSSLAKDSRIKMWTAHYEKDYNPLALGLFWFLIAIITGLVIWFLFIRNAMYPKFKTGKIQVLSPYFGGIQLGRGIRLVILSKAAQKQSMMNKFFTGKIQYEVNSIYEMDLLLRPGRGNKIKIKLPIGSKITPPVVNLEKYSKYKIEINKQLIEIQYS